MSLYLVKVEEKCCDMNTCVLCASLTVTTPQQAVEELGCASCQWGDNAYFMLRTDAITMLHDLPKVPTSLFEPMTLPPSSGLLWNSLNAMTYMTPSFSPFSIIEFSLFLLALIINWPMSVTTQVDTQVSCQKALSSIFVVFPLTFSVQYQGDYLSVFQVWLLLLAGTTSIKITVWPHAFLCCTASALMNDGRKSSRCEQRNPYPGYLPARPPQVPSSSHTKISPLKQVTSLTMW